jgi:ascorbate-specific PTS system EIIC-type component UlaA
VLCAPLTLTGDNRQLAVPVEISCACGAFMILVPYFNAMAYGLRRFTWVNAVMLAGQAGYVLALLILWLTGTLTPLAAALAALEPVINFVPLESRKYPNVSLSLTMEAWGTRGKSAR